jgi:hypothetical protein
MKSLYNRAKNIGGWECVIFKTVHVFAYVCVCVCMSTSHFNVICTTRDSRLAHLFQTQRNLHHFQEKWSPEIDKKAED